MQPVQSGRHMLGRRRRSRSSMRKRKRKRMKSQSSEDLLIKHDNSDKGRKHVRDV